MIRYSLSRCWLDVSCSQGTSWWVYKEIKVWLILVSLVDGSQLECRLELCWRKWFTRSESLLVNSWKLFLMILLWKRSWFKLWVMIRQTSAQCVRLSVGDSASDVFLLLTLMTDFLKWFYFFFFLIFRLLSQVRFVCLKYDDEHLNMSHWSG